jgi:TRAP transporter TAXI family solute receptor
MAKLDFNRVVRVALMVVSLGFIAVAGMVWLQQSRTESLTLAAGASDGESYILGRALKIVLERHYPRIRLTLLETGGTVENLSMLEEGRAQLAAAQADIAPGPKARSVVTLYDDTFQLLVAKDSPLRSFVDLKGHSIALTQNGGQFQSFLHVADHFGLRATDFTFVGGSDQAAGEAFLKGKADAIFRVRAIGDPSIESLVQSGRVRFLPIDHAAAMKIKYPAFNAAVIPEGAYLGNPPVPERDFPTVSIHRTLLARDDASLPGVRAITEVLLDRREEMMQEIPTSMAEVRLLLVQVRRPDLQSGLSPALQAGALSFYDKDKPSFLLAHADYVGLMLTVGLMAASWIWELKRWIQREQKNHADQYSNRVVGLISEVQYMDSLPPLAESWRELLNILSQAVRDLDADKLSEESFNSFRAILQIGLEVTKERRALVMSNNSLQAVITDSADYEEVTPRGVGGRGPHVAG